MFRQQPYSIQYNINESSIINIKTICAHNTTKTKNHIQLNIQEKIGQIGLIPPFPLWGEGVSPLPLGGGPIPPLFPSQARRWRDESNDARLYPHGPYALGALYFLRNVIVYYINRIALCRRSPLLRLAFEYSMLPWRNK